MVPKMVTRRARKDKVKLVPMAASMAIRPPLPLPNKVKSLAAMALKLIPTKILVLPRWSRVTKLKLKLLMEMLSLRPW